MPPTWRRWRCSRRPTWSRQPRRFVISNDPVLPGDAGEGVADPERRLALLYAPAAARPALAALWRLDERLGQVVASTAEPMIGRIRLAWWREALERLDTVDSPAEPLLATLAGTVLPRGVTGAMLAGMEPGWSALLDVPADVALHAEERGGRLFALAESILLPSSSPADPAVAAAGMRWALADLAHRLSDAAARAQARARAASLVVPGRWPPALRPLGALSVLAARDLAAETRTQGAPGRAARMLLHRLTGR